MFVSYNSVPISPRDDNVSTVIKLCAQIKTMLSSEVYKQDHSYNHSFKTEPDCWSDRKKQELAARTFS